MKDLSEVAVGLAYSSILFNNRALAAEVGSLEADTSAFRGRFAWTPPRTLAEELADAFAPGAPL